MGDKLFGLVDFLVFKLIRDLVIWGILIGLNEKLSFCVLFLMVEMFGWFMKLFIESCSRCLLIEGVVKYLLNSVLGLGIKVFFLIRWIVLELLVSLVFGNSGFICF